MVKEEKIEKFRGHGIDFIEQKKYVSSALENGGGVFRIPLPDGELGKELEEKLSKPGMAYSLQVDEHGNIISIIGPA